MTPWRREGVGVYGFIPQCVAVREDDTDLDDMLLNHGDSVTAILGRPGPSGGVEKTRRGNPLANTCDCHLPREKEI